MNDKKYTCYISSSPVFWTINSIDKPTDSYIESLEYNKIDFTPNWVDNQTITIVADKQSYTVLKLIDNEENFTYYFLNSNINKKMAKGYLLTFELDVWATYCIDFMGFLAKSYISSKKTTYFIKVNRTNNNYVLSKLENIQYQPDPTLSLESYPLVEINNAVTNRYLRNFKKITIFKEMTNTNFNYNKKTDYNINALDPVQPYGPTFYVASDNILNKPIGWVYESLDGDYIVLVQVAQSSWLTMGLPGDIISNEDVPLDQDKNLRIESDTLSYLRLSDKITFLANRFIGKFEIPFFENIKNMFIWPYANYVDGDDTKKALDNSSFIGFYMRRDEYLELGYSGGWYPSKFTNGVNYDTSNNEYTKLKFNDNEKLNRYVVSKSFLNNWNLAIGLKQYFNASNWNYLSVLDNNYISFDGNNFNLIYNISNPTIASISGALYNQFRGTFNVATNSYNSYVAGSKQQQNTGLQVAKQQFLSSSFSNLSNGLQSVLTTPAKTFGSLLKGDLGGAASNLFGGIFGVVNTGLNQWNNTEKYKNYVKGVAAKNLDAKNSATANNIGSSVTTDDVTNKLNLYKKEPDDKIGNPILVNLPVNKRDIVKLNNYIYLYGKYVNAYVDSADLFKQDFSQPFIYIDCEIENDEIYRQWMPNLNVETLELIKTMFANSFRMWNGDVDYTREVTI